MVWIDNSYFRHCALTKRSESNPIIFLGFTVKREIKSINSFSSLTRTLFTTPKADSKPIIPNDAQSVVSLSSDVCGA